MVNEHATVEEMKRYTKKQCENNNIEFNKVIAKNKGDSGAIIELHVDDINSFSIDNLKTNILPMLTETFNADFSKEVGESGFEYVRITIDSGLFAVRNS